MPRDIPQIFVCDRGAAARENLCLDAFDQAFLRIARHLFAAFETPEDHSWMQAFMEAETAFPPPFGATIAHGIAIALNAIRAERLRPFAYIRPTDPVAPQGLTDEERYLLLTLRGLRSGNAGLARTNAMLLCDGGAGPELLAALERLAIITGDVTEPAFQPA